MMDEKKNRERINEQNVTSGEITQKNLVRVEMQAQLFSQGLVSLCKHRI